MPLLCCCWRSFAVIFASRLSSSFSRASWRQRALNSHAAQWWLSISGGGVGLACWAAILLTTVLAMSIHPATSTLVVACLLPWMIFPQRGASPETVHKTSASKANRSLSCVVIFSLGTHRIGIYGLWFVLPGETSR